jgi:hypothetical protein
MDDDVVLSLPLSWILLLTLLPLLDDSSYSCAQVSSLRPAGVGQRRVVGCRRCEVPLLVGLVKSSTVSVEVSEGGNELHYVTYLAIITTAGCLPILSCAVVEGELVGEAQAKVTAWRRRQVIS